MLNIMSFGIEVRRNPEALRNNHGKVDKKISNPCRTLKEAGTAGDERTGKQVTVARAPGAAGTINKRYGKQPRGSGAVLAVRPFHVLAFACETGQKPGDSRKPTD